MVGTEGTAGGKCISGKTGDEVWLTPDKTSGNFCKIKKEYNLYMLYFLKLDVHLEAGFSDTLFLI